jgi:hypothetical protein
VKTALAIALSASTIGIGCSSAHPPPITTAVPEQTRKYSSDWVLVSVLAAHVTPASPGDKWDHSQTEAPLKPGVLVGALGTLIGGLGPMAAAISAIDAISQPKPKSEEEELPDPFIEVTLHHNGLNDSFRSATLPNTYNPNLNHRFYVQLSGLDALGLDIALQDDDGKGAENIGLTSIPREKLQQVVTAGAAALIDARSGDIASLQIRVEPVDISAKGSEAQYGLRLKDGALATPMEVAQGAVVTVSATGHGRVSAGGLFSCTPDVNVTPGGLSNNECRQYNIKGIPELASAPHGSAYVIVGRGNELDARSMAESPECLQFVAGKSGPLVLGINDQEAGNNDGEFAFRVTVTHPGAPAPTCSHRAPPSTTTIASSAPR